MAKPGNEHQIPSKRGRPKKAAGAGMIPKNVTLTIQDELALRRLAGALQQYYIGYYGVNTESLGASWAARALIRFADRQTRGWNLGMDNDFLKELVTLGDVNTPHGDAAD